jgi:hypothetical protein
MKPRRGSLDWIRTVLAQPSSEIPEHVAPPTVSARDKHRTGLVPPADPLTSLDDDGRDDEAAHSGTADQ